MARSAPREAASARFQAALEEPALEDVGIGVIRDRRGQQKPTRAPTSPGNALVRGPALSLPVSTASALSPLRFYCLWSVILALSHPLIMPVIWLPLASTVRLPGVGWDSVMSLPETNPTTH